MDTVCGLGCCPPTPIPTPSLLSLPLVLYPSPALIARVLSPLVTLRWGGAQVALNQEFLEYRTTESGAYLFTPAGPAGPLARTCPQSLVHWTGPVADVLEWTLIENVTAPAPDGVLVQRAVLVRNAGDLSRALQLEVSSNGAISPNRELITRFSTDLANEVR